MKSDLSRCNSVIITSLLCAIFLITGCSSDDKSKGSDSSRNGIASVSINDLQNDGMIGLNTIIRTEATNSYSIGKVEFYVYASSGSRPTAPNAAATSEPFQFKLNTGTYTQGSTLTIEVLVYSTAGAVINTLKKERLVVDKELPTVSITSPAPDSTLNQTITISSSASDVNPSSAPVDKVEFYLDDVLIGTDATASGSGPYTFEYEWNTATVQNDRHKLTAVAYDTARNTASAEITLTTDNQLPVIAFVSPTAGNSVSGTVPVSAVTSDNDGIVSVAFYSGTDLLATDTVAPYQVDWDTTAHTSGNLRIVSTDNAGNQATASITVAVDNQAPAINSISGMTAGGTYSGNVDVTVNASDNYSINKIELLVDGKLSQTLTSPPSNAVFAVATGLFQDGSHTLVFTCYDAAGLTADRSLTIYMDNNGPSPVRMISPTGGQTVSGAITLRALASDSVGMGHVEFVLDGTTSLGTGTLAAGEYTLSWNTASGTVADGEHSIDILAYDAAGHLTEVEEACVCNVDNASPSPLQVISPADGSSVHGTVTFSIQAADVTGIDNITINIEGTDHNCTAATSDLYRYDWNSSSVADDDYTVTVTAQDLLGLSNSTTVDITVDNTAPSGVALTSPANGSYVTGNITLTATATDASRVEFYVDGGDPVGISYSAPYTYSWNTAGTPGGNGQHSIKVIAWDVAGNSTVYDATTVTVDNTSPAIEISYPKNMSYVKGNITLTATASDNIGVDHVVFSIDGTPVSPDTSWPFSHSWDTTGATNGSHTLTAEAIDRSGNNVTSGTVTVIVDNERPTITFGSTVPASNAFVRGTLTIAADAADNTATGGVISEVRFKIDGTTVVPFYTSPYEYEWDTSALANASSHTIEISVLDAAGNTNASTVSRTFRIDNVAPGLVLGTLVPNDGSYIRDTVQVSAVPNDSHSGLNRVDFVVDGTVASSDTSSPYTYDYNTSSLGEGLSHTIEIRAYDNALNTAGGNGNMTSLSRSYTVDNLDPGATYSSTVPASGSYVRGNVTTEVTPDGTGSSVSRVEYHYGPSGSTSLVETDTGSPYSYTWNTASGTSAGDERVVTVRVYDSAITELGGNGNYTDFTRTYTVDNTVPSLAFGGGTPADGSYVSDEGGFPAITATASDSPSGIKNVDFRIDGTSVNIDSVSPYENVFDLSSYTEGTSHIISLVASDNAISATGGTGNASTVSRTFYIDRTGPEVSITSPSGPYVTGTLTISANASDNISNINRVEFYHGTTLIGSDNTSPSPYQASWNTTGLTDGQLYSLTATAYDNADNSTPSSSISVTVDNTGPVITIDYPVSIYPQSGMTVTISGTVSDTHSNITAGTVEFSEDGTSWVPCIVTGTTYTCTVTSGLSAGSSGTLYVRATNGAGLTSTQTRSVSVPNDTTPPTPVTLDSPAADATIGASTTNDLFDGQIVTLTGSAADSDSGIYRVDFYYNDGTDHLIGSDYSAPYTYNWDSRLLVDNTNPKTGVTLFARAYNYNNLSADSTSASVTVDNSITLADSGNITGYLSLACAAASGGDDDLYISYYYNSSDLKIMDSSDGGAAWNTAVINSTDNVGQYNSLAFDGAGTLHASYYNATLEAFNYPDLMHSRYTTSWQNTTVDDNGTDLTYTGEYTSIAFNGANGFIAYYDSSNTNLKLARSTNYGVSWGSIQNIDYSEDDGQYTSIAVDTSNNYYVSYYNNTDNELKLSVNNIEQTVYGNGGSAPSSNDVGKYSSIALVNASPNRLYIAYYDTTYGAVNVSHSHDNATSWTHVQVDNGGSNTPGTSNVGEYCSIAAVADRSTDGDDTGDDLYICYYDVTNTNLKFARSNDGGTTWSSRTIDSASVNAGQYARIAVVPASDSYANDRIYVVYYNAVSSTIKVLKSIDGGTSW